MLIANTAIDSARGNSGTIIAQFFHGMRKSLRELKVANINDFAAALQVGYQSANDSLLKPEEGTIITVMRDVATTANDLIKQENMDFITFLNECYKSAEESLQRTKTILKILQKTGVVDAGALGFMISSSATTVLGFSLSGQSFSGCGTMVELALDGEPTGLSSIVVSDPTGSAIDIIYFDGSGSADVH